MAAETWQVIAGTSAAVAAVAAAASAVAAWRASTVTLRITREISGDAGGGAPPKRRSWWRRLHIPSLLAVLMRRPIRTPRLKYDGHWFHSPKVDPDFERKIYEDPDVTRAYFDNGIGQVIHLINTSDYAAYDVEVEIRRGDDVVSREPVACISPIPLSAVVVTPWTGCQFYLPDDGEDRNCFLEEEIHRERFM